MMNGVYCWEFLCMPCSAVWLMKVVADLILLEVWNEMESESEE